MKYLLLILLILVAPFIGASAAHAQAMPLPSPMFCIGSCPTLSPSPTLMQPTATQQPQASITLSPPVVTTIVPSGNNPSPATATGAPSPTMNPCAAASSTGNVSSMANKKVEDQNNILQHFI